MADKMMMFLGEAHGVNWYWAQPGEFENPGAYYWDGVKNVLCVPHISAPEAPAQGDARKDRMQKVRDFIQADADLARGIASTEAPAQESTHVYEDVPSQRPVGDRSAPVQQPQEAQTVPQHDAVSPNEAAYSTGTDAGETDALVGHAVQPGPAVLSAPEAPAQVGLLSDEDLADCGLLSEFGQVSMPQEECPKCGSVEWDDIYERGYPPAVGRRCARCDHEWNLAVEAKTYGDGTKAVGTAPLPLQSPAETQSAHGDVSGEVIAMRGDFDGYGYRYIDSGSGSDWRTRHPDWEPLMLAVLVEDERAAFEAWAHTQGYEVKSRKSDGRYWSSHTHQAWECWQARAALAQLDSLGGGE